MKNVDDRNSVIRWRVDNMLELSPCLQTSSRNEGIKSEVSVNDLVLLPSLTFPVAAKITIRLKSFLVVEAVNMPWQPNNLLGPIWTNDAGDLVIIFRPSSRNSMARYEWSKTLANLFALSMSWIGYFSPIQYVSLSVRWPSQWFSRKRLSLCRPIKSVVHLLLAARVVYLKT